MPCSTHVAIIPLRGVTALGILVAPTETIRVRVDPQNAFRSIESKTVIFRRESVAARAEVLAHAIRDRFGHPSGGRTYLYGVVSIDRDPGRGARDLGAMDARAVRAATVL